MFNFLKNLFAKKQPECPVKIYRVKEDHVYVHIPRVWENQYKKGTVYVRWYQNGKHRCYEIATPNIVTCTRANYRYMVNHFANQLIEIPPSEIKWLKPHFRKYIRELFSKRNIEI